MREPKCCRYKSISSKREYWWFCPPRLAILRAPMSEARRPVVSQSHTGRHRRSHRLRRCLPCRPAVRHPGRMGLGDHGTPRLAHGLAQDRQPRRTEPPIHPRRTGRFLPAAFRFAHHAVTAMPANAPLWEPDLSGEDNPPVRPINRAPTCRLPPCNFIA